MIARALITGIAALFSATGAAYATELPDHMFGAWCELESDDLPDNERLYEYSDDGHCDDVRGIFIFDKGYQYMAGGICEFTSIKFARHEANPGEDYYDVFVVRADCKGRISTDGEYFRYTELFEISTSESLLSRRFLSEG
jgi:hypothetical protein